MHTYLYLQYPFPDLNLQERFKKFVVIYTYILMHICMYIAYNLISLFVFSNIHMNSYSQEYTRSYFIICL